MRHPAYNVRYPVVPINSSMLTITLHSSVVTILVYYDTKYSFIFMTLYNRVGLCMTVDIKMFLLILSVFILRMNNNNNRMPKIMKNYRTNGRRRLGRPLKRLLDEAETGLSRNNWWRMMMMMMMMIYFLITLSVCKGLVKRNSVLISSW
jgi:hypothetical protein